MTFTERAYCNFRHVVRGTSSGGAKEELLHSMCWPQRVVEFRRTRPVVFRAARLTSWDTYRRHTQAKNDWTYGRTSEQTASWQAWPGMARAAKREGGWLSGEIKSGGGLKRKSGGRDDYTFRDRCERERETERAREREEACKGVGSRVKKSQRGEATPGQGRT